jgi:glycosyltransferase involved in cell wall biosynthesis
LTVSVAIPVLDGERYLEEVLAAVFAQRLAQELEVLVIDSGSRDRSLEIARSSGAAVIEIAPEDFGHGRTRNLAMARTSGELVAFLTQDATPASEDWLRHHVASFRMDEHVGASYGPHLPRPDASPIVKRLLLDFFHDFSPSGEPVIQRRGDATYFTNSNSCVARAAWEQIPFREIPYAEDQALGADLLAAGWTKVFNPSAGVIHSHDYGMFEFFKRYFDEYRGMRDSVGQRTQASPAGVADMLRRSVSADRAYLRRTEPSPAKRARWTAQSVVHHSGRLFFGGLGERADMVWGPVRGLLSLDRRGDGVTRRVPPSGPSAHDDALRVFADGVAPLSTPSPFDDERRTLELAWVVPPYGIGSGGQAAIFRIMRVLEARGHRCSLWVHDPKGIEPHSSASLRRRMKLHYTSPDSQVELGFENWTGCDVAVATGWETVYPVLRLPGCRARAYFVQDHEPEFFATSSESVLAAHTYRFGLPVIASSRWLGRLVADRYGADVTAFDYGIEAAEYHPVPEVPRRVDTVLFYARDHTPRRAVGLGLLALQLLLEQRPHLRVVMYGTHRRIRAPFAFEQLGMEGPERLRRLYSEATVGLSLSLTNHSLIAGEMMACGLPVVELAGRAGEEFYGADGSVITLARDDPADIAAQLAALLDDPARRARQAEAALEFVRSHAWEQAGEAVESALRGTLAARLAAAKPLAGATSGPARG